MATTRGERIKRRLFDRRSGVDRRREDATIYWPERRKADRRSGEDRRSAPSGDDSADGVEAVAARGGRLAANPERMASRVRDWLSRLPGSGR